tara:strand:- start:22 stop:207 length:186 start_codon:yes stop_codon:yes gene_type:complete
MTHHLIDPTKSELQIILDRLLLNDIPYAIEINESGLVTMVETDDAELLAYCEANNPNLVPV